MVKIRYVCGNLLDAPEGIISHGCNAKGVMGSGVALSIKNKWPGAYSVYRKQYEGKGLRLGMVVWAHSQDKIIANCIVQSSYGRLTGIQYVDYNSIRDCMQQINKMIQPEIGLAMPRIGAKRGGGDWSIISGIVEKEITNAEPVVYVLPEEWRAVKHYVDK